MSEKSPTLQDIWKLLGRMHWRFEGFDGRFDGLERQMVALEERLGTRISTLEARVASQVGALKASIEARDFRLDEQGRRLAKLEDSLP
jgi:hypothetical protein